MLFSSIKMIFPLAPLSHVQWGAVLHSICALYVKDALK